MLKCGFISIYRIFFNILQLKSISTVFLRIFLAFIPKDWIENRDNLANNG